MTAHPFHKAIYHITKKGTINLKYLGKDLCNFAIQASVDGLY